MRWSSGMVGSLNPGRRQASVREFRLMACLDLCVVVVVVDRGHALVVVVLVVVEGSEMISCLPLLKPWLIENPCQPWISGRHDDMPLIR